MTCEDLKRLLEEGALALGVPLDEGALSSFLTYLGELKEWNSKINLTAITGDREIIIKHFLDSLAPLGLLRDLGCRTLLDIGAGGGFPGIPLKIAEPALSVTLLDSVEKKVRFMRHIIRTLDLSTRDAPARSVSGRAEEAATLEKTGGGFDCVTSRAFSSIKDFLEVARPYARTGGWILAVKGPQAGDELEGLDISPYPVKGPPEVTAVEIHGRTTTLVLFQKS